MKIEKSTVTKMTLSELKNLDPITVYAEDIGPRQGKIIIECYGKSWSAYWGGCGDNGVAGFFVSCSDDYLAGCLDIGIASKITDSESIKDGAFRQVISLRRGRMIGGFGNPDKKVRIGRNEISNEEARDLWDEIDGVEFSDNGWNESELLTMVFGDEWWYRLPTKLNPDYQYLCRIIVAVQSALKESVA